MTWQRGTDRMDVEAALFAVGAGGAVDWQTVQIHLQAAIARIDDPSSAARSALTAERFEQMYDALSDAAGGPDERDTAGRRQRIRERLQEALNHLSD